MALSFRLHAHNPGAPGEDGMLQHGFYLGALGQTDLVPIKSDPPRSSDTDRETQRCRQVIDVGMHTVEVCGWTEF